jgi:hypothetical protein
LYFFQIPGSGGVFLYKKTKEPPNTGTYQFKNWTENWPRTHTENNTGVECRLSSYTKAGLCGIGLCGNWTENSNVQGFKPTKSPKGEDIPKTIRGPG